MLCLLLAISTSGLSAQNDSPLVGPLIATTPARQDQILLHDIGAGATRTLSFGAGEHHVWDFSPDGCRVLFTLDEDNDGLAKLYTARLDGSDRQALVAYSELPEDAWGVWEPDWSPLGPDGRDRIAFTMMRDQTQPGGEIERTTHTAWIDGSASVPTAPQFYSVTGREFSPQWSPDGAWLAYVSYDERLPGEDVFSTAVPTPSPQPDATLTEEAPMIREADLWVVSSDAETKYRLTAFVTGSVRSPRWSPDGSQIAFVYSPGPSNDTFWMVANQPGAEPVQLSFFWNLTLDLTWLPDSSALLASARDFRETSQNRLWRIPLSGNADTDASLYVAGDDLVYTDYPRFSARGRYLAFRSEYTLVVLDTQDRSWQRLDTQRPGNMPPVWSPEAFRGEAACQL